MRLKWYLTLRYYFLVYILQRNLNQLIPYYHAPTEWRRLFSVVSVRHYVHREGEGVPWCIGPHCTGPPPLPPPPDMRPHCTGPLNPAPASDFWWPSLENLPSTDTSIWWLPPKHVRLASGWCTSYTYISCLMQYFQWQIWKLRPCLSKWLSEPRIRCGLFIKRLPLWIRTKYRIPNKGTETQLSWVWWVILLSIFTLHELEKFKNRIQKWR